MAKALSHPKPPLYSENSFQNIQPKYSFTEKMS